MKSRLVIFALLTLATFVFAGEASWIIPGEVEVHRDKVFLGDLLSGTPPHTVPDQVANVFVIRSPQPGESRTLNRIYLASILESAGLENVSVPDQVRITRPGMTIDSSLGQAVVLEYIRNNATWPPSQYQVRVLRAHSPVVVSEGEVTARVMEPHRSALAGRHTYQVEYLQRGRKVAQGAFSVEVNVQARVYRAAHMIRRGVVLARTDLVPVEVDLAELHGRAATEIDQLVGSRAKRTLREGEILTEGCVEPTPVISRGDAVVMIAKRGCVVVRAFGIAQEQGAVGDVIKIKNIQSRKIVHGRVMDANTVQVLF